MIKNNNHITREIYQEVSIASHRCIATHYFAECIIQQKHNMYITEK